MRTISALAEGEVAVHTQHPESLGKASPFQPNVNRRMNAAAVGSPASVNVIDREKFLMRLTTASARLAVMTKDLRSQIVLTFSVVCWASRALVTLSSHDLRSPQVIVEPRLRRGAFAILAHVLAAPFPHGGRRGAGGAEECPSPRWHRLFTSRARAWVANRLPWLAPHHVQFIGSSRDRSGT